MGDFIDVAGFRYKFNANTSRHVDMSFRSRNDYIKDFGNDPDTLRILKTYMSPGIQSLDKLQYPGDDKQKLIAILKKRSSNLRNSNEFNSTTLKNNEFRNSHSKIDDLVRDIELSKNETKNTNINPLKVTCDDNKKALHTLEQDKIFELILELSWMLLHPDKINEEIACDWAALIKKLDTLTIGHLVKLNTSLPQGAQPINAFTSKNLRKKVDDIIAIDEPPAADVTKERIEALLSIFTANKELRKSLRDKPTKVSGGSSHLDKPIATAMIPLFDYFKDVYDPIYSFLEKGVDSYKKTPTSIVLLLKLLHICNHIPISKHGIYRIIHIDKSVLSFINHMLTATTKKLHNKPALRNKFNKQLSKLPNVRLSTLLHSYVRKNHNAIPPLKFLTYKNVEFIDTIPDYFNKKDLYIVYNEFSNYEDIPMNVYDIDFKKVDISDTHISINTLELNPRCLDDVVRVRSTFNHAELALSIFIALKELLPQ